MTESLQKRPPSAPNPEPSLVRESRRIDERVQAILPVPPEVKVKKLSIDIPVSTVVKVLAVLALAYLLAQIWQLVMLFLVSAMLAVALVPYRTALERQGLPRGVSLAVVAASIIVILAGIGALVIPPFVSQTHALLARSDEHLRNLQVLLANFGLHLDLVQLWHSIPKLLGSLKLDLIGVFRSVVDSTVALLTVVFVTIYMVADLERIERFFVRLFPAPRRPATVAVLAELHSQVGGYVRGQLITSLLAALFSFIVLIAAGIPNAIALAVFVGIADLVPLFGQTLGTIPAVVALTVSPLRAVIVLAGLVFYQQIENHYIVPRVYSNTMNVSSLVALVGLLIGAKLLGMVGMLLALPVIASLPVILRFAGIDIRPDRASPPEPDAETPSLKGRRSREGKR